MLTDEDLIAYERQKTTEAEYDLMRAKDITEEAKDNLDNVTSEIELALEYRASKALSGVLENIKNCIEVLDDFVSGVYD